MKILVIGGSGFIGTRLTKTLHNHGHAVQIQDKAKSLSCPDLCVNGDVRDKSSLLPALKGCDLLYNLAAEHRDDVAPRSLYWDVNVMGAENVCAAAEEVGINKIIFTSSVAVYGFTDKETGEDGSLRPFNDYGKTKLEAEAVYRDWQKKDNKRSLVIVRPTVVFGEGNRGNVYNLLNQVATGRFIMVGSGKNIKSMAYVENVAAFLEYSLNFGEGIHIYNYVDKPDFDINSLVAEVYKGLGKDAKVKFRMPYSIGFAGGKLFDLLSLLTGKKYPVSSIRIKKFCADTSFATSISQTGFIPPVSLHEGLLKTIRYEFIDRKTGEVFYAE